MNAYRRYALTFLLTVVAPVAASGGEYPICEACGCSFCAAGLMMANPTANFVIPEEYQKQFLGLKTVACGTIQSLGLNGNIPPEICVDDVRLFADFRSVCGCPPAVVPPPTMPTLAPIMPKPTMMPVMPPPPVMPPMPQPVVPLKTTMSPISMDDDEVVDVGPGDDDDAGGKPAKGGKKAAKTGKNTSNGQEKMNKNERSDDDDNKIARDVDNKDDDGGNDDDDDEVPVMSKGEKSSKGGGGMKRRVRRIVAHALNRMDN